jgi:hypothetical protein
MRQADPKPARPRRRNPLCKLSTRIKKIAKVGWPIAIETPDRSFASISKTTKRQFRGWSSSKKQRVMGPR